MRKLGAELGTHPNHLKDFYSSAKYTALNKSNVKELEEWIDGIKIDTELPRVFVWGDTPESAKIDTARAICRRLECDLTLLYTRDALKKASLAYINRLSDYLWAVGRYVEPEEQREEPKKKRSVWDLGTGGGEDDAFSLASIQDANM